MKNVNHVLPLFKSALFSYFIVNILLQPIITLEINTSSTSDKTIFDNVFLSTAEIIQNNGYAVESHNVVTEDGYILEMHRIPRGKNGRNSTRTYPVLFHHAFLSSSAQWVLSGANASLSMRLADDGYDVWLANCRGNTYSIKHVLMTPSQKAFWNFSLHEIGKYDLPASIDYILTKTNVSQLHYIGYSMGTSVFFIMASERPEYQPKIRSQISLAPVAYLFNTRSPIKYLAPYAKMLNIVYQMTSNGMFMPKSKLRSVLASAVCGQEMAQKYICQKAIIFFVSGSDPVLFNSKIIPIMVRHFPAGTSSKLVVHFSQLITKDSFCQYDYGPIGNLQHYNATEPPVYDLKSIQVPITLIYGKNDIVSDVKDVMRLKSQLPRLVDVIRVKNPYCNHVDMLWSLKVNEHVNEPVKGILRKTDDPDWAYTGPNPGMGNEIGVEDLGDDAGKRTPPNLVNRPILPHSGFYLPKNLDTIIANAMPSSMDDKDAAAFERERELQKVLFGNVIEFARSAQKKYGRLWDEFINLFTADRI